MNSDPLILELNNGIEVNLDTKQILDNEPPSRRNGFVIGNDAPPIQSLLDLQNKHPDPDQAYPITKNDSTNYKYHLYEADFSSLASNCSICLVGKRRAGKTSWARYICQHLKLKCPRFIVICGAKDTGNEWAINLHPLFIMDKHDLSTLLEIRNYQNSKVPDNGQKIPDRYKLCLIIDDMGHDARFLKNGIMKDILTNGRHYGISIIILCQYFNQLPADSRAQIDYLGMLRTNNDDHLKKVAKEYCGGAEYKNFKHVAFEITSNHGLCWIDNTNQDTIPNPNSVGIHIPNMTYKRMNILDPIMFEPLVISHTVLKFANTYSKVPYNSTMITHSNNNINHSSDAKSASNQGPASLVNNMNHNNTETGKIHIDNKKLQLNYDEERSIRS